MHDTLYRLRLRLYKMLNRDLSIGMGATVGLDGRILLNVLELKRGRRIDDDLLRGFCRRLLNLYAGRRLRKMRL